MIALTDRTKTMTRVIKGPDSKTFDPIPFNFDNLMASACTTCSPDVQIQWIRTPNESSGEWILLTTHEDRCPNNPPMGGPVRAA